MKITVDVGHECYVGCGKCYGTGEGWSENSSCVQCRGRGYIRGRGEVSDLITVSVDRRMGTFEIVTGFEQCDYCGKDLGKLIVEELKIGGYL